MKQDDDDNDDNHELLSSPIKKQVSWKDRSASETFHDDMNVNVDDEQENSMGTVD